MAIANEIVTKFSFLGSLKPQQSFNANLSTSIKIMGAFAAASKVAAIGAFAWADSMFGPIDEMGNLAKETKNTTEALQQWNYAAEQNNSSAEAVTASMRELTLRTGEYAKFGGGSAKEAFEKLGLSAKNADGSIKNSSDLMLDLADSIQGMAEGEQLSILDKMGIDKSMLQTMRLTREELTALQEDANKWGLVSQEDADAVVAYGGAMADLKFGLTAVQSTVAVGFAPMMTDLVKGFANVLKANKDWIVDGLKWLGNVIVSVSGFVSRMYPFLIAIAVGMGIAKLATFGFAKALAVVFSPVVLITAAIVAVLLIIDDLIVAFQGGQSVIADFFQEFFGVDILPALQSIVDVFIQFVGWVEDAMDPLLGFFKNIFGAIGALFRGDLTGAIDFVWVAINDLADFTSKVIIDAVNKVAGIFEWLGGFAGEVFKPFFDYMSSMFSALGAALKGDFDEALSHVGDAFGSLGDFILGVFTGAFNGVMGLWGKVAAYIKEKAMNMLPSWVVDLLSGAGSALDTASGAVSGAWDNAKNFFSMGPDEAVSMSSSGGTSNSNVEQNIQMTVMSSDPQAAATAVTGKLQDSQRRAKNLAKRGGQ